MNIREQLSKEELMLGPNTLGDSICTWLQLYFTRNATQEKQKIDEIISFTFLLFLSKRQRETTKQITMRLEAWKMLGGRGDYHRNIRCA